MTDANVLTLSGSDIFDQDDALTREHRDNLEKLADFLEAFNDELIRLDAFHMEDYVSYKWDDSELVDIIRPSEAVSAVGECGASACAIGWGTWAVEPRGEGEYWDQYSRRVFGISESARTWTYLFGPNIPDVPSLVARRIREYLKATNRPLA